LEKIVRTSRLNRTVSGSRKEGFSCPFAGETADPIASKRHEAENRMQRGK
jgi:hypothetical protein